jgi:exopolyphosphatase/guanosine-5'-triphosphate,3'-diphosphate pyrophosphatase
MYGTPPATPRGAGESDSPSTFAFHHEARMPLAVDAAGNGLHRYADLPRPEPAHVSHGAIQIPTTVPPIIVNMTGLSVSELSDHPDVLLPASTLTPDKAPLQGAGEASHSMTSGDPPVSQHSTTNDVFKKAVISRLKRWGRALAASGAADSSVSARGIHKVRVLSRRLEIMIRAMEGALEAIAQRGDDVALRKDLRSRMKRLKVVRREIKGVRSGASVVRDSDVHLHFLDEVVKQSPRELSGLADARCLVAEDRAYAAATFSSIVRGVNYERIEHAIGEELTTLSLESAFEEIVVSELLAAAQRARTYVGLAARTADGAPTGENFHAIRLGIKRARYARETLAAMGQPVSDDQRLVQEVQGALGEINDIATLTARVQRYVSSIDLQHPSEQLATTRATRERLHALSCKFHVLFEHRVRQFCQQWTSPLSGWANGGSSLPEHSAAIAQAKVSATSLHPLNPENMEAESRAMDSADDHREKPRRQVLFRRTGSIEGAVPLFVSGSVLSVVDIGSNSVRLLVVRVTSEGSWEILAQDRAMTRLGHGLAHGRVLNESAVERTIEAIAKYKSTSLALGAVDVRIYATAAVRDAVDGVAFTQRLEDELGLRVTTLSGHEEGLLTFESVASAFDVSRQAVAVADLGGGSLEVVQALSGVVLSNVSMQLGAVRLSEKFATSVGGVDRRGLLGAVNKTLQKKLKVSRAPIALIGCGGTFTTLSSIVQARQIAMRAGGGSPEPGPISRREVREVLAEIHSLSPQERASYPGLPADRADIIVAGLTVIARLMRHLKTKWVYAHTGGLREGLVQRAIRARIAGEAPVSGGSGLMLRAAAEKLALRCAVPNPHSEHVAKLSLTLYDSLLAHPAQKGGGIVPGLGSWPGERDLLYAAALLHDCGTLVSYAAHHKHSFSIVKHNLSDSLNQSVLTHVALIARYHRKRGPSTRQREFTGLNAREQDLVRRLTGVLRIADGLDRRHECEVERVRVEVRGETLVIEAIGMSAGRDISEELNAAAAKSDVLEKVTSMRVVVRPL